MEQMSLFASVHRQLNRLDCSYDIEVAHSVSPLPSACLAVGLLIVDRFFGNGCFAVREVSQLSCTSILDNNERNSASHSSRSTVDLSPEPHVQAHVELDVRPRFSQVS